MPRLGVIVASTRPGRVGLPIASWFANYARDNSDFEVDLIDLADVGLPIYNEPHHPRLQRYEHEATKQWSQRIAALDALVIVTAEYNYNPPPAVVNALDYLFYEWRYLPVGIASYGGVSAGLRAAQVVRTHVTALRMVPVSEAISLPMVAQFMKDGDFQPNELAEDSAKAMLAELAKMAGALAPLRAEPIHPPQS